MNLFADKFNALKERQGKDDVRTNPRAVKRLQKEAIKVKDILSANKNVQIKIGELLDYVTLQFNLERKEFEDAAVDLFSRVNAPVDEVLKKAGLTLS